MKDGKRKEQMKNGKECKEKVKIVNCQMGLSFVLWPPSLKQLSSLGCFNT